MADFDDPKDRIEEESTPNASEKRPLGFEQEPSPANLGRRLILKFALMGTAAALLPKGGEASLQGGADETPDPGVPVERPYSRGLSFQDQPAILSDSKGDQGQYLVSGQGDLYIDAQGSVFLSNIQATGRYVGGTLNHGTFSVVQPTPSLAGTYSKTRLEAQTTVLYSDGGVKQQPAMMKVSGEVYQGGSNIWTDIHIEGSSGSGVDWEIRIGWSKATC